MHFNIDYYGLLESDICSYVCTCMWTAFTQMSLVTAVNEYTLGFTHTSNCPTISDVKVCAILYNTLVLSAAFSLGCFWGVLHPPIVQIYPPISVSEAAARVMACKADLYSIIITKQLYTCKNTAINCTIVTLGDDRGWIRD